MTTVEDTEKAVEQPSPHELAQFRAWSEAFDAQQFETAIEHDAQAGKFDVACGRSYCGIHRAGRAREL